MTGFVYAIEAENGLIKLGYSRALRGRITKMRSDNQMHLRPLGYVAATRDQEIELHKLLAFSREHGEWYRPSREVMRAVSMMTPWTATYGRKSRPRHQKTALAKWMAENDCTTAVFAERVGTSQAQVSRIAAGLNTPRTPLASRIVAETGGAVTFTDLVLKGGVL